MSEKIPSQSTMTDLLGQPLFEVWQKLCVVIDEKYEMNDCGMLTERIGFMSINIAGEEKRSAACTQKTIASGS